MSNNTSKNTFMNLIGYLLSSSYNGKNVDDIIEIIDSLFDDDEVLIYDKYLLKKLCNSFYEFVTHEANTEFKNKYFIKFDKDGIVIKKIKTDLKDRSAFYSIEINNDMILIIISSSNEELKSLNYLCEYDRETKKCVGNSFLLHVSSVSYDNEDAKFEFDSLSEFFNYVKNKTSSKKTLKESK